MTVNSKDSGLANLSFSKVFNERSDGKIGTARIIHMPQIHAVESFFPLTMGYLNSMTAMIVATTARAKQNPAGSAFNRKYASGTPNAIAPVMRPRTGSASGFRTAKDQ
jgi:hypothetical protein